ncbi:MAG: 50S ribosomal protein L5 [Candidatus Woesearchaeota archaeon]|nr:50S ribosomal protein L5 [Candidatus Woesearchaeota archaeon]
MTQELMNPMRQIRVAKVTLNIGAGKDAQLLEKGVKLLEQLTGVPPVKTITKKRIPSWGLRPGLPIGCKVTLRGKEAMDIIPRLLSAKENNLSKKNYDSCGNVSFGIPEYIDIDGAKYDPEIGIIGLQVCITLTRPGYRVKLRKIRPAGMKKSHIINQDDAIQFMDASFKTRLEE